MITLSKLFFYPVKSCAGVAVRVAEVGHTGLEFDRRWMVVDGAGVFLSQRRFPALARVVVTIEGDNLTLSTAGSPARWFTRHLGCESGRSNFELQNRAPGV